MVGRLAAEVLRGAIRDGDDGRDRRRRLVSVAAVAAALEETATPVAVTVVPLCGGYWSTGPAREPFRRVADALGGQPLGLMAPGLVDDAGHEAGARRARRGHGDHRPVGAPRRRRCSGSAARRGAPRSSGRASQRRARRQAGRSARSSSRRSTSTAASSAPPSATGRSPSTPAGCHASRSRSASRPARPRSGRSSARCGPASSDARHRRRRPPRPSSRSTRAARPRRPEPLDERRPPAVLGDRPRDDRGQGRARRARRAAPRARPRPATRPTSDPAAGRAEQDPEAWWVGGRSARSGSCRGSTIGDVVRDRRSTATGRPSCRSTRAARRPGRRSLAGQPVRPRRPRSWRPRPASAAGPRRPAGRALAGAPRARRRRGDVLVPRDLGVAGPAPDRRRQRPARARPGRPGRGALVAAAGLPVRSPAAVRRRAARSSARLTGRRRRRPRPAPRDPGRRRDRRRVGELPRRRDARAGRRDTIRAARPAASACTGIGRSRSPGAFSTPAPLPGLYSRRRRDGGDRPGARLVPRRHPRRRGHDRGAARRGGRRSRPAPTASSSCRTSPASARRSGIPTARGAFVGLTLAHGRGAPDAGDPRGVGVRDPPRRRADARGRRRGPDDARLRRPGPERDLEPDQGRRHRLHRRGAGRARDGGARARRSSARPASARGRTSRRRSAAMTRDRPPARAARRAAPRLRPAFDAYRRLYPAIAPIVRGLHGVARR